jgi:hypothetical protein
MMDSIRIETGVKKIQINDGPEYIEFNPADVSFAERFYQLIRDFEAKQVEYQKRAEAIDANKELDANGIPVNLPDGLAMIRDVCEFMREKIDGLFGKDTSRKAFGDALSLSMFEQFFTGITPFIKTARANKVAKYQKQPHSKRVMK